MALDSSSAIAIAVVTAAVFLIAGVWRVRRSPGGIEDYLVARNSAGSALGVATVVASVAGAWILFSPAEAGTWAGVSALIGYGVGQAAPLLAFAWIGPRMRSLMPSGHSLTEFVWHRYGGAMWAFTLLVMVFYMFVFLSAELTGIGLALKEIAGVPLLQTALIVGVITVAYTAYGGLRASIFTDGIQFVVLIPLLAVTIIALVASSGGLDGSFAPARASQPQLLDLGHTAGIDFGVTLIIAILAANMFHQGFWQRVYASKDDRALRRSFGIAGLVVIPMIIVAGLAGVIAAGKGIVDNPSVAMFSLIGDVLPTWAIVGVLALALALVMSSLDTLLNGIASAVTTDLARFKPDLKAASVLRYARAITVALVVPAIFVASQGYSVLYLFLIADMVCAAAVFPVFWGMFSRRFGGASALAASACGLVGGMLFFPTHEPPYNVGIFLSTDIASQLLMSFGAALGVSVAVSLAVTALSKSSAIRSKLSYEEFDFRRLRESVRLME